MKQLHHNEIQNEQQDFPVTIVCDELRTPENIGMCFRIAESFGVEKIFLHENSPSTENRIVKRTARSTLDKTPHEIYTDFEKLIYKLKKEGNIIIGIEVTDTSFALQDFDFTQYQKLVLLLGSERKGIKRTNLINASVMIPMYGSNSSMNVIHSLAITLYELTNQLKNVRSSS